ncbi:Fic family protein [Candidatus Parcubacteria bacterium]|nr:Fic family protein [Patescibacteria group bacterium]MCG2689240.1 Fic family protein [Candidatus Parcubacteria bacterium]
MSYQPQFTITSSILKSVSAVENAKAIIETSPLLPLYERQFKNDAFVRMAHFGTAVEGNKLNLGNVRKIIDGKGEEVIGRERDIQEVINYRKVIAFIDSYRDQSITSRTVKHINHISTEKVVGDVYRGSYRHNQNYFMNLVTQETIFTPPPADEVVAHMEQFIEYINGDEAKTLHPAIKASIVHERIVSIHPFVDGNGRTARACATLSLYLEGYDIKKFFSLEEYYDRDVLAYYKAISDGHTNLTVWIEYFCEGLAIELTQIKERVLKMSRDAKLKNTVGQVYLSEREEKIIDWLTNYGRLTNKDFEKLFPNISEDTVLRDLKDLIKHKIVAKRGSTKSSTYELKR